jgi:alpha-tubulin suppressor-like RCC1 family protein
MFIFGPRVAVPAVNYSAGPYLTPRMLKVSTSTPGASLYYTTDGQEPTESSTEVGSDSSISLGMGTTTLKVKAFATGYSPSLTFAAIYTIGPKALASTNSGAALDTNGTVWMWGSGSLGHLGNGQSGDQYFPDHPTGINSVMELSLGDFHTLALKTDSTVWGWGHNGYGQLGDSSNTDRYTPVAVKGLGGGVKRLGAGFYHSFALKSDGTLWAWGNNGYGQLGDSTTTSRTKPVQVKVLTSGVVDVTGGWYHSLALKEDGTVWAWGRNDYGQLGVPGSYSVIPMRVGSVNQVVAIAAGQNHSLALKADGTVWAWGYNGYGQLGDNTSSNRASAVQVQGLTDVVAIGAGYNHSVALKRDGTMWAWGVNNYGQLGDSTTTTRYTPVQVKLLSSMVQFSAGKGNNTVALKSDGTLWAFGHNAYGQLGIETTASSLFPVVVHRFDADKDGLEDWLEYLLGSDPTNKDSNGDGVNDGPAYNLGLSLTDVDMDGDGLSNSVELAMGTDPFDADTDGDDEPDATDDFPLDPTRSIIPSPTPGDVTAPSINLILPTNAVLLP